MFKRFFQKIWLKIFRKERKVTPYVHKKVLHENPSIRNKILAFEEGMKKVPGVMLGDCFPLKHVFVDGAYVRQISMPKGMLVVSKIHKVCHPYFILKGDVSVMTEDGPVRLRAPYSGVTPAGTKRVLYIHEDTIWTTVHVTNETDLDKIEEEIIAKNFKELGLDSKEEEQKLLDFVKEVQNTGGQNGMGSDSNSR